MKALHTFINNCPTMLINVTGRILFYFILFYSNELFSEKQEFASKYNNQSKNVLASDFIM